MVSSTHETATYPIAMKKPALSCRSVFRCCAGRQLRSCFAAHSLDNKGYVARPGLDCLAGRQVAHPFSGNAAKVARCVAGKHRV